MIYVDNAQIPYGRMKMCHMFADTTAELEDIAREIGLPKTATIQNFGEPGEHIDVSMTHRDKAVKAGAIEVSSRELVKFIRRKRKALSDAPAPEPAPDPEPIDPELGEPTQEESDAFDAALEMTEIEVVPGSNPDMPKSDGTKITIKAQTYNEDDEAME